MQSCPDRNFDVRRFGAQAIARPGEQLTLAVPGYKWLRYPPGTQATIFHASPGAEPDSVGIQRAIDAAHAAGGGTVMVPAGNYLIAPLVLRSRVRLHLEPGARLWASPHLADYVNRKGLAVGAPTFLDPTLDLAMHASPLSPWPGGHLPGPGAPRNLIAADDADDVAITGLGEIHAQSPAWIIPWLNAGPTAWSTLTSARPGSACLRFGGCNRVLVEGVRICDSPSWTLVFSGCTQVRVRDIRIHHFDVINADGIDVVDSANVTITGCDLHVTDDGICLKSDPTNPNAPGVRNVVISDCIIRSWCNGVKVGTEGAGVFQDISVDNVIVHSPPGDLKWAEGGLNLCACDGSTIRNVRVSGMVMRNVECPFYLVGMRRARYQAAYREPRAGTISGVSISDLRVDGFRYTPFVVGHPDRPMSDIRLSSIAMRKSDDFPDAIREQPYAEPVPPVADQYPTGFMFGSPSGGARHVGDGLPAHGLYLRHVRNASIRDLAITAPRQDIRPLLVHDTCDRITTADCTSVSAPA